MTRPYLERKWVQVTLVVLFGVAVLAAYIALTDDSVQRDQDGVRSRVEWHWPGKDAIPPALALIGVTSFGAAWWIRRNPADPEPEYEPPMYDDHLEDDVDLDDDLDDEPAAHRLTSFAQIRGLEDHPEITNRLDAKLAEALAAVGLPPLGTVARLHHGAVRGSRANAIPSCPNPEGYE